MPLNQPFPPSTQCSVTGTWEVSDEEGVPPPTPAAEGQDLGLGPWDKHQKLSFWDQWRAPQSMW